jgi:hypothetical protein
LLFDAFTPAAYRSAGRRKAKDAERWLVFFARHLEYTIISPDLAWWQLRLAVPGFAIPAGVVAGIVTGVALGVVFGIAFGLLPGIINGAVFRAFAMLSTAAEMKARESSRSFLRFRGRRPRLGNVVVGVVYGVVAGVLSELRSDPRLELGR